MKHVLHSFSCWLPRTQTWCHTQIRHLPSEIRSHVVCETTANLDEFPVARLHAVDAEPWPRRIVEKVLRRLKHRRHPDYLRDCMRRLRPDLVHSHFGSIGWQDHALAREAGAPQVVTFYGADVTYLPRRDPRWRERYAGLFAGVGRVLCEGPHMARRVEGLGCPAGRIRVHHLGVSVGEIPCEPRTRRAEEPLRVLVAASFVEKKGIPDGIEALGRVAAETPVELTLIGDAAADPRCRGQKEAILAALERTGLGTGARLLGYQPHRVFFEELRRAHVFLAPSRTASDGDTEGGAPVGIIEASASGMPVVSTTHCDIPEVIRHRKSGLLAEEGDVGGLARHLSWIAAHPERWSEMGRAGRRHVEAEFDARTQARRLAAIYEELFAAPRTEPATV